MKCNACSREIADDSAFCAYCGSDPKVAREVERTAAFDTSHLAGLLDRGEDEGGDEGDDEDVDKTVSMSASEVSAALAASGAAAAAAADESADEDDEERTVAMQVPPELMDDEPTVVGPLKPVLGQPGAALPSPAAGIDPFGATMQTPAITDDELSAIALQRPGGQPMAPRELTPAVTRPASSVSGPPDARLGARPQMTQANQMKSGGGGTMKWVAIGAGVAVVIGVIAAVIMMRGGGMGGSSGSLAASSLPKDVNVAGGISVDQLRSSWMYKEIEGDLKESLENEGALAKMKEVGVDLETLTAIAFGTKLSGDGEPPVAVVATGKFDAEKIGAMMKEQLGESKDVGGKTFFGDARNMAGLVADDTMVGGAEAMVAAVMATRGGGDSVTANEAIAAALATVDGGAALWVATGLTEAAIKMMQASGGGMVAEHVKAGDGFAASLDMSGDLVLKVGAVFGEEDRAKLAFQAADGGFSLVKMMLGSAPPEEIPEAYRGDVPKLLEGISLTLEGKVIHLSITVPEDLMKRVIADGKKQLKADAAPAPVEEADEPAEDEADEE